MKTILATAYAINPFKGSEDGMGWNFILQIARFNKVIAITRENNRVHIEKYMREFPNDLYGFIEFHYFDLPYWMRFWKKGGRGAMLYYWMWQKGIISFIKQHKFQFDIAHNVNFHNDWTPSYLWQLHKPFVWGPIGHHSYIPRQYLSNYKLGYLFKDRLTWYIKNYFWNLSRDLQKTKKHSAHTLCMNKSVPVVLGLHEKYSIVPSVATQDFGWVFPVNNDDFILISAGRFVPLKGFDLTIRSFAQFLGSVTDIQKLKCQLILVGTGPEENLLKRLVNELGINNHIRFIPWIERGELMKLFKESSAFIFPSHEGAGMVVAEALSFGLPVICLDNEGPGEFIDEHCGYAIPNMPYEDTVKALSNAILDLFHDPEKKNNMRKAARKQFETNFLWDRRGEQLEKIYNSL